MTQNKTPAEDSTVLYGIHPVMETLRAGRRPVLEVYLARTPGVSRELRRLEGLDRIPVIQVTPEQIRSIAGTTHHQGVAAKVGPFPYADFHQLVSAAPSRCGLLVILDQVQDPANLGSILRSSECFGAFAVLLAKDRTVPVTPAVEKASSGASAHVPVVRVVNIVRSIEHLKQNGWWIYAAEASGATLLFSVDLTGRAAVVLGSEGKGIRRLVREVCDGTVAIPMTGKLGSLSVSQAAAVVLAESVRQTMAGRDANARSKK